MVPPHKCPKWHFMSLWSGVKYSAWFYLIEVPKRALYIPLFLANIGSWKDWLIVEKQFELQMSRVYGLTSLCRLDEIDFFLCYFAPRILFWIATTKLELCEDLPLKTNYFRLVVLYKLYRYKYQNYYYCCITFTRNYCEVCIHKRWIKLWIR